MIVFFEDGFDFTFVKSSTTPTTCIPQSISHELIRERSTTWITCDPFSFA